MQHARKNRVFKPWDIVLAAVISLIVLSTMIVTFFYFYVNSNIQSENIEYYLEKEIIQPDSNLNNDLIVDEPVDEPEPVDSLAGDSLNYVIIGSDSRENENSDIVNDGTVGARSDVTMIAHISHDRRFIDVVSIPRDSIVTIPDCRLSDGSYTKEQINGQFNNAFAMGDNLASSIACTVSTITENTGLDIDGYIVADFNGFQETVDAIGGITMNVPEKMVSKKANLNLDVGVQRFDGETALAFVRARTFEIGSGIGSDIERIERQQELLSAITEKIFTFETLSNPKKIINLTNAVTNSFVVNPELANINSVIGLAYSLRHIDSENINFHTVPWETWSENPNRIIWTDEANNYWNSMKKDIQITH